MVQAPMNGRTLHCLSTHSYVCGCALIIAYTQQVRLCFRAAARYQLSLVLLVLGTHAHVVSGQRVQRGYKVSRQEQQQKSLELILNRCSDVPEVGISVIHPFAGEHSIAPEVLTSGQVGTQRLILGYFLPQRP